MFIHDGLMPRTSVKHQEPNLEHMRIGATIREMRVMRGMSQDELAHAATISRSYVANTESGRYRPSDRVLVRIAAALHVPQISIIALADDAA